MKNNNQEFITMTIISLLIIALLFSCSTENTTIQKENTVTNTTTTTDSTYNYLEEDSTMFTFTAGKGDELPKDSVIEIDTVKEIVKEEKLYPDDKWISSKEWRKMNVTSIKWVQNEYIKNHLPACKFLSDKTGVPVSLIMAQGMIESRYGRSRLAITATNFFGVKWTKGMKNKRGLEGYVIANDDSPTDKFRHYSSKWWAYYYQAQVLQKYIDRVEGDITINKMLMALCRLDNELYFREKLKKGEDPRYYASVCKCKDKKTGKSLYAVTVKDIIRRFNLTQYDE